MNLFVDKNIKKKDHLMFFKGNFSNNNKNNINFESVFVIYILEKN